MIHLRNGRADRHAHTRGAGSTWCGKKLLGAPETSGEGGEIFTSYGNRLHVTFDPERGTCPICRSAFDAAYAAAFPDGLKPIATFRYDDPGSLARAKSVLSVEALNRHLGPGGGGIAALTAAMAAASDPFPGEAS